MSLLSCLQQIHDPRSRHRREYPLHGLLAILILAAAHGETSLQGMWQWGKKRASLLMNFFPLGLWAKARFPSLGTFWYLLSKIPPGACEQALAGWCVSGEESYALDGKTLRGSKRAEEGALRVVTLVGHRFRQELAQREAEGGG